MVSLIHRTLIWFLLCTALVGWTAAYADRIYLKDGTVEESERVWQSSEYIHFILKGTEGVEIRYAKEIVERVQIDGVEESIITKSIEDDIIVIEPKVDLETKDSQELTRDEPISNSGTDPSPSTQSVVIDRQLIKVHKGTEFYAPRRNQRYWAANNSRHTALGSALSALSQIYGRSPAWVERHMGSENDLGAIHRNLIMQHERESVETQTTESAILIEKKSPSMAPLPPSPTPSSTAVLEAEEESVPKGLEFYQPRRKEKYWTGNEGRFNTLDDAMGALAQQYGVTEAWIDQHMGHTNDLTKIHKNIQNSLK